VTKTTLRDILNLFFRHFLAVSLFCAVVLAGAVTYYFQSARIYKSTAKIMVSLGPESLGRGESLNDRNILFTQRAEQLHNEQEILKSNAVLSTVSRCVVIGRENCPDEGDMKSRIEELRLYFTAQVPQPTFFLRTYEQLTELYNHLFGHVPNDRERIASMTDALDAAVDVKPIFDSDTLELTFKYRNPTVAQTLLRLVLAAYYQHHIEVFQNNGELALLKTEMDSSVDGYKTSLSAYSNFVGQHKIFNDSSQADMLVQQRDKSSWELTEAEAMRDDTASRAASLDAIKKSLQEYETFATVQVRSREREALVRQLNDAEVAAHLLLTKHPESSRTYQDQEAQVREIRLLLNHEPADVMEQTEHRKSKAYETVEADLISLNAQSRGNDARVALLRDELAKTRAQLTAYAADLEKFGVLKLSMETARHQSEMLAEGYLQNRMRVLTARNAITNVSTIDPPNWNPIFASPNKKMLFAATLLLLVAGSMAVVVMAHHLDTTISYPQSLVTDFGAAPLAAAIPFSPGALKRVEPVDSFMEANQREFAQLYQVLKADPSKKVVLVAKSRAGEGGSLVGLALARSLSRYGSRKTVFLDCTSNPVTEHAEGVAVETCEGNRSERLQALRAQYDSVVVATGPVRDATDLSALSPLVDVTLFLVEAEKTRTESARYNLDLLRRFGFKDVQLVLNKRRFHIPAWIMRFV
jgi:uncharacterized protein involved in exopolysaccharide biosynthesis